MHQKAKVNMNSEIIVTEVKKANQLKQEGKLEDAITVYRGLTEKLYRELGKLLSQQKNWDEAIATYRRALELNPEDYECHYQLGEAIYQRVMENPETFFSKYNLAEVTHKDYQIFDPELPEICFLNDQSFLQATAHLDDATYTIEWYKVYLRRSLSETEKQACINWLQTPGHSRELGIQVWREGLAEFQTLLKCSYMTVGLEEAINCYRSAIELYPYHHPFYKGLVESLTKQGKREEAISIYHQLGLYLAEADRMDEAIACFQNIPNILLSNDQKTYDLIWDELNELRPINTVVNLYYPSEISLNAAYEYFANSIQYTVVNLWSLNDSDRLLLENLGLSIENLGLIKQDNITLEEIYINSFDDRQGFQLSRKVKRHPKMSRYYQWDKAINLQQSIVETGFVYSVCPFTGKILRSNQSFYVEPFILYRFVGKEVFYLMYGDWMGSKQCIYLPSQELIIALDQFPTTDFIGLINMFKTYSISNWQKIKSYISPNKKKICAVVGIFNVGHYVWNELSGIYYLGKNETINNVDNFLVSCYEHILIDDIFPSIPSGKIIRLNIGNEVIFQNIIENNLFAVRLIDTFIEEELAKQIYQTSLRKCTQNFLEQVEIAKNHFPLLWITLRNYKRTWSSQIEGTANIIKSLHTHFPNLAVVFDGWSVPERDKEDASNQTHIKALEKDCLQPILNLLPPEITTYSTIGHPIYETIVWAEAIDLYSVPLGTGMTFVTWIASKPGVGHGTKDYYGPVEDSFSPVYRENAVPPVLVSKEYITEDNKNNPDPMTRNYDCDWQVIYNELMQILQNLPKRI